MKAESIWFPAERQVEIRTEEIGPCGPTEVTAQAIVSGISHGTEMSIYRGQAPSEPTGLALSWDDFTPTPGGSFADRFPIKYAYSNVARVIDAGKDSGYKAGDIVFARAPHQTHFNVDAALLTALPSDLPSLESATTLGLLDVAVNAMLDWPIVIGDVVVVSGLGVVGLFCVELARRTASVVIAVDPIKNRRDKAMSLGADIAVTPEEAIQAVKDLSSGRGADVTIECSGAPSALQLCIEAAGAEATVLIPSYYGLKTVPLVLSPEFHMRRLRFISSSAKEIDGRLKHRWSYERRFELDVSLLGPLRAAEMISHRIPYREASSAYQLIDESPEQVLSVVLTYDDTDNL